MILSPEKRNSLLTACMLAALTGCGGSDETANFTVTATATAGGSISPGSANVPEGGNTAFTLTPNTGYSIDSVTGCGGTLSGSTYTTGNITANCTVTANFKIKSYAVTASAASGGKITPATSTIEHGKTASFTVAPDVGYSIASVEGCGGKLSGNMFETAAITSACAVTAKFSINSYVVTASASHGGSISLTNSPSNLPIEHGSVATFSLTTNPGYQVKTVVGCGGTLNANIYTTAPITAACSVDATFLFVPIGGLNDTGIDWCADNTTNNLNCPVAGFEGQDGEFGRDAKARAGTLTKIGGGAAGFDYSKLGADGKELAIQNVAWDANGTEAAGSQWSCVRDNVTGLIWEVKTTDGGLRDMNNTYTWYNPDMNTNGGDAGTQNGGQCSGSGCDTHAFVQAVNSQGLCGANDWRMPAKRELMGIVNNGQVNPAIDTAYFPNTSNSWFWSSSPGAGGSGHAWFVDFYDGGVDGSSKYYGNQVRLVRAGQ